MRKDRSLRGRGRKEKNHPNGFGAKIEKRYKNGQVCAGNGYRNYIVKFDGRTDPEGKNLVSEKNEYTKIEYAYYLLAQKAGIQMTECFLHEENGCHHFLTERFDRISDTGQKVHMLSLGGMAHFDFNSPRTNSYEEAIIIMKRIGLGQSEIEQFFRRMIFNEYALNYDDHVKNISFLMDKNGTWRLAPAYDVTFAYNPNNRWIKAHQMLINGKAENITKEDFFATAKVAGISKMKSQRIMDEVFETVGNWEKYALSAGISDINFQKISESLNRVFDRQF